MAQIREKIHFDRLTETQYDKLMSHASPTQTKLKNFPAHVRDFFVRLGHLITNRPHQWENNASLARHLLTYAQNNPGNVVKANEIFQKIVEKGLDIELQLEFNKLLPSSEEPAVKKDLGPNNVLPQAADLKKPESDASKIQKMFTFDLTYITPSISGIINIKAEVVQTYINMNEQDLQDVFKKAVKEDFNIPQNVDTLGAVLTALKLNIVADQKFEIIKEVISKISEGLIDTSTHTRNKILNFPLKLFLLNGFPLLTDLILEEGHQNIQAQKDFFFTSLTNTAANVDSEGTKELEVTEDSCEQLSKNIEAQLMHLAYIDTTSEIENETLKRIVFLSHYLNLMLRNKAPAEN